MCSSLVVGEILFIGAMKTVYMYNADTMEELSSISTSEWVFSLCMLDDHTLICGQSYGFIDIIKVQKLKMSTALRTKFERSSHIYAIQRTSRMGEFVIGGFDGIYFGQITDGHIGISTEQILGGKTVKQIKEFAPNRFIVGIDNYPAYLLVDRVAVTPSEQVKEIYS
jgi:hypothetical protein